MNFICTIEIYEPCRRGGGSVVRRHAQGRHGRAGQRVLPVLVAVRLGVDPCAVLIAERRGVLVVGLLLVSCACKRSIRYIYSIQQRAEPGALGQYYGGGNTLTCAL